MSQLYVDGIGFTRNWNRNERKRWDNYRERKEVIRDTGLLKTQMRDSLVALSSFRVLRGSTSQIG